ncbi:MAG: hypothetical protein INR73_01000 [Williamsia sp.]|nr:hypothetical protein [Williamsia sp.]
MDKASDRTAFAALDIGTSQVKLGVYCTQISERIVLVNNLSNTLVHGKGGEVATSYAPVREKAFDLFRELGPFLKQHRIRQLFIGICGHVSSLIEADRENGVPPQQPFPIWLDTSSYSSLDEYRGLMDNGRSREIIGTILPAGTNWLLTKLLHRRKGGFTPNAVFLQIGDALFYDLCGAYHTHFSSQISMVNLRRRAYAPELLRHLGIDESFFPSIRDQPLPMQEARKKQFDFPAETFVFPAMADLYTSLYGLRLQDREGFMLANTSEQAGAFYSQQPRQLDRFLSIVFQPGFVNYGSTNTGSNIVHWFVERVLKKKGTPVTLQQLSRQAARIDPADTPIVLPYLQGERAPLWNSALTASMYELRSSHTHLHLFRAVLESIAFARKQCFEEIGTGALELIKMGGGSSKNELWNTIRASALNKRLAIADEKELSLAGLVDHMIEQQGETATKPAINFSTVEPRTEWVEIYEEKYQRFIRYQRLLGG